MANPSPTYDNVQWPGGDGLRIPQERAGLSTSPASLQTYGEVDLGTVAASPYKLTSQQAGASLITMNPTVPMTLIFPTCQPGQKTLIQNTNAVAGNTITCEVNGNVTNTALVAINSLALVVQTGTNGGMALVSGT